jgi:hypothetical protein
MICITYDNPKHTPNVLVTIFDWFSLMLHLDL